MKTLLVYSTLTGNTKKIADAIADILPNCAIHPINDAPDAQGYDLVVVGYWVNRGRPDSKSATYLASLHNCTVALFGTLGAYPDSEHAAKCRAAGEALLVEPARGNTVLGTFLCQGKVEPRLVSTMQKSARSPHPMTAERKARLEEAAKHPNAEDCHNAQTTFRTFLEAVKPVEASAL